MSGPKCDGYAVVRNQRLDERARQQAVQEARSVEARVRALLSEADALRRNHPHETKDWALPRVDFGHGDAHATREAAEAYVRHLRTVRDSLETKLPALLARIEGRKRSDEMAKRSSVSVRTVGDASAIGSRALPSAQSASATSSALRTAADVVASRTRTDAPASKPDRGGARTAQELLATSQRPSLTRDIGEAEALRDGLRGLSGEEIDAMRRDLEVVINGQLPMTTSLRTRTEFLTRAALDKENAAYAAEVLQKTLSDLGYDVVDEEVETLFIEGGLVRFQRSSWKDYFVRMKVNPGAASVDFNIVRVADDATPPTRAQQLEDTAMEAAWCTEIPQLRTLLRDRGIALTPRRQIPPGEQPVQVLSPKKGERRRRVSKERSGHGGTRASR